MSLKHILSMNECVHFDQLIISATVSHSITSVVSFQ